MGIKFLITSAGLGTRLGTYSKYKNKALITLGTKPAISHIIDRIPYDAEIIIALGYKGELLEATLKTIHADRKIKFVTVDIYEGSGSGLGYTMRSCKNFLQSPFIFIPNDTIIYETNFVIDPLTVGNWIGVYKKRTGDNVDPQQYRCVEAGTNKIHPKGIITDDVYIGLCGINDYETFWSAMENDRAVEEGESFGLNFLHNKRRFEFPDWFDTGNISSLTKAENAFSSKEFNILPKENEAIWITDNTVLKYHDDQQFISDRIKRVSYSSSGLYPKVRQIHKNIYAYSKIPGKVFSEVMNVPSTKIVLHKMQDAVWSKTANLCAEECMSHKEEIVEEFYKTKSLERLRIYKERFEVIDQAKIINGEYCASMYDSLNSVDWKKLTADIILAEFHGDFHGENIIFDSSNNKFKLIDWRQNFGSNRYHYGDVYYDLAKFQHGLIVAHYMVATDNYFVTDIDDTTCQIDIRQTLIQTECRKYFEKWLNENNYQSDIVNLLTALIFLNIAPLHHYPYSKFLYYLGQYLLQKAIKN